MMLRFSVFTSRYNISVLRKLGTLGESLPESKTMEFARSRHAKRLKKIQSIADLTNGLTNSYK